MQRIDSLIGLALLAAAGCGPAPTAPSDAGTDAGPTGIAVLGSGAHTADSVVVTEIAGAADDLAGPRDLAFHPEQAGQLWVVNAQTSSVVVIHDAGGPAQSTTYHAGPGNTHFMPRPTALAFGAPGFLATAHEQDEVTQPTTPEDFMGPTLWTSDVLEFDGGHASHYDMLHNSPNAVGIAWERDNVYWVVDGRHRSITRYDFALDHGPGGEDHSDAVVARYVYGELGYWPDVASHAEIDRSSGLLYVADGGNDRIAVLDMNAGTAGAPIDPNYDGTEQYEMNGTELRTLVDGASAGLSRPSGLALRDGVLYVTDNARPRIVALDLEGNVLDWLELDGVVSDGGLMGIEVGPEGDLWIVDAADDRVLRITPGS